jgi:hypothetical protein
MKRILKLFNTTVLTFFMYLILYKSLYIVWYSNESNNNKTVV